MASLPSETIRWNHELAQVTPRADGSHDLVFQGRQAGPFDLVVGADGAWSRVRPLLSAYRPHYSGLTFIEFGIDEVDTRHPDIAHFVGRGKTDVQGDGKGLIVQRNGHAHLRAYAIFRVPADWAASTFDFSTPAAARARLVYEFRGWAPKILHLIAASNDLIVPRPIHALPIGHHWPHRRGVTLIGDAAHVMSPFGGEGVNAAMLNAAELARHLSAQADWDAAVEAYEAEMFVRVAEPAHGAAEAAATELSHLGLELSLAHLKSHVAERSRAAS